MFNYFVVTVPAIILVVVGFAYLVRLVEAIF